MLATWTAPEIPGHDLRSGRAVWFLCYEEEQADHQAMNGMVSVWTRQLP